MRLEEFTTMITVFVATTVVLVFSLFALMAIVPMLIDTGTHGTMPDNLVQLDQVRRHDGTTDRTAA